MNTAKKKLVLSGSSKLRDRMDFWKKHFEDKGYAVTAMPGIRSDTGDLAEQYKKLYVDFYAAIDECDVFFLANEDKNGTSGYIGANGTAELVRAVVLKLTEKKEKQIYIAQAPSRDVLAYDEVTSFLRADWIKVYEL